MRRTIFFAFLVVVILIIASTIFYLYIYPAVSTPTPDCALRGCQSDLGNALMYEGIVVAIIIAWLWAKLR